MMTSLLVPFANAGDGGTVVLAVWAAVTLVAAIVLFVLCRPKGEGAGPRGIRAFLSFERHCTVPVTRFVYLLGSVGGLTFLAASVAALLMGSYVEPPVGYLAALVAVIVAFEVLLRVVCELVVLVVRMADGVSALSERVDGIGLRVEQASREASPSDTERLVGEMGARIEALAASVVAAAASARPAPAPADGGVPRSLEPAGERPLGPTPGDPGRAAFATRPTVVGPFRAAAAEVPLETERPDVITPYEEIPAVFDATTYDEFASRGAFEPYEGTPEEVPVPYKEPYKEVPVEAPAPYAAPSAASYGYGYPAWDCPCGSRGNTGAFCGNCGRPRPL